MELLFAIGQLLLEPKFGYRMKPKFDQTWVTRSMASANCVKHHGNLEVLIPLNQRFSSGKESSIEQLAPARV